jgi:hypothetical protein
MRFPILFFGALLALSSALPAEIAYSQASSRAHRTVGRNAADSWRAREDRAMEATLGDRMMQTGDRITKLRPTAANGR